MVEGRGSSNLVLFLFEEKECRTVRNDTFLEEIAKRIKSVTGGVSTEEIATAASIPTC